MDTQTRHALKQDKLIETTGTAVEWFSDNRDRVMRFLIPAAIVLVALIAGLVVYQQRSSAAELAFGQAMDTYNSPLAQAGQPAAGAFTTTVERAKSANQQFLDVAKRYGFFGAGKKAKYFAGLTYMEMNQAGNAENLLKEVADGHNADLASLAKVALASLYQQSGRTAEAVALYQQLIAKPTSTVPANAAQLELAALYDTTNPAQAKKIYAQLKNDKTAAGQIAAQKLAQK